MRAESYWRRWWHSTPLRLSMFALLIYYLFSLILLFGAGVVLGFTGRIAWEGLLVGWRLLP